MRRTILSLCIMTVLAWAAGTVLAQGQGQGKEPRGGAVQANKPGETARVDVNAPAAEKKVQDAAKETREKAKGAVEQGQARGKAMTEDGAGKMAQTKGKAQEQQMRAFEKQIQQNTAQHMKREAQLARLRELAVQKGDTERIARIDKLIAKEKQLYDRKLTKLQSQKRAGGTLPGMQGKDRVDVNKPAELQAPGTSSAPGQATPPAAGKSNEAKPK